MATPEEKTWGGDGGKGIFMKRVLFICTKNSARSQMAEGLVNHDLAGEFQAFSAGTDPSAVHPILP